MNPYFSNFNNSQEQQLIDDLTVESINIYGMDLWYLPRKLVDRDQLYGEDTLSRYDDSYVVEMYAKNVFGFQGQGDFLSKFNLEIRDQMVMTVARTRFNNRVATPANIQRPQEGDLVYFPLNKKMFRISFVEHEPVFYQMGALQAYDLTLELWEYSSEILNTGIPEIDDMQRNYSLDMVNYAWLNEDGTLLIDEAGFPITQEQYDLQTQAGISLADNDALGIASGDVIDWSEVNPFTSGGQ